MLIPRQTIGIDKLGINEIEIVDIDYDRLQYTIEYKRISLSICDGAIRLDNGKILDAMKIVDNVHFADLQIWHNKYAVDGERQYNTLLTFSVGNIEENNMNNMPMSEMVDWCDGLVEYIYEEYGILLDFQMAKVKTIEINCNFPIKAPFSEYMRVLRLLMSMIPGKRRFNDPFGYKSESIGRGNKQCQLVFYDKSLELQRNDGYNTEKNLMRLELKLINSDKVKKAFGTALLHDIRDEDVMNYFCREVEELLHIPYDGSDSIKAGMKSWKRKNDKEIQELIEKIRRPHVDWIYVFLETARNREQASGGIPWLLDIEDLIRNLPPDPKNRHTGRTINNILKKRVEDIAEDVFYNHDAEKIDEIFACIKKAKNISLSDAA